MGTSAAIDHVKEQVWKEISQQQGSVAGSQGVKVVRGQVTAVDANNKVRMRRPQNDAPDGPAYPVLTPAYIPVVGDWVTGLEVDGGIWILGRPAKGTDRDVGDLGSNKLERNGSQAMTGHLTLPTSSDPSGAHQAAKVKQVEERLSKEGGTMTGQIFLPSADPTLDNQAAKVKQVNARLPLGGGTLTGQLWLPTTDPILDDQASKLKQVRAAELAAKQHANAAASAAETNAKQHANSVASSAQTNAINWASANRLSNAAGAVLQGNIHSSLYNPGHSIFALRSLNTYNGFFSSGSNAAAPAYHYHKVDEIASDGYWYTRSTTYP